MIPFLDVSETYEELKEELDAAYQKVMDKGWFILGDEVSSFEREFAQYCGQKHAIGVASGLDALVIPLMAWGIGPGDEVIVPDFTFVATWLAVSAVGAVPVPVACDRYFCLEPAAFERALTTKTRAVIPVHLYGQQAKMDEINRIAEEGSVKVLEDAAQAHGSTYLGTRAGGWGHAAGFSFYPGKNLGAFGDGGCIVTDHDDIAATCRRLRNYGSATKYHHLELGTNSRLDELQAAFLRVKLKELDNWNERRRDIARRYQNELTETPLALPQVRPGAEPVWHLYVVRSAERTELREALEEAGIQTGIHYPVAPGDQPCFPGIGASKLSRSWANEVLSLPMGPHLSDEDVSLIIDALRRFHE